MWSELSLSPRSDKNQGRQALAASLVLCLTSSPLLLFVPPPYAAIMTVYICLHIYHQKHSPPPSTKLNKILRLFILTTLNKQFDDSWEKSIHFNWLFKKNLFQFFQLKKLYFKFFVKNNWNLNNVFVDLNIGNTI